MQKKKTSRKTIRRCGTVIGGGEGVDLKFQCCCTLKFKSCPDNWDFFGSPKSHFGVLSVDQNGCFTMWILNNIINKSRGYDRFQLQKYQSCKHLCVYGQFHTSGVRIQVFKNKLGMKLYCVLWSWQVTAHRKIISSFLVTTMHSGGSPKYISVYFFLWQRMGKRVHFNLLYQTSKNNMKGCKHLYQKKSLKEVNT